MAKRKMLTRRRRKKKQFASPKKLNPHQLLFPQFQDDVQVYFNPVPTKFVDNLKENLAADAENFHALLKDLGIVEHRASKFVQKVPNAIASLSIQKINKIVGKVMKRTSGTFLFVIHASFSSHTVRYFTGVFSHCTTMNFCSISSPKFWLWLFSKSETLSTI